MVLFYTDRVISRNESKERGRRITDNVAKVNGTSGIYDYYREGEKLGDINSFLDVYHFLYKGTLHIGNPCSRSILVYTATVK